MRKSCFFPFHRASYQDGTYIRSDGNYERLNHYSVVPKKFVYPDGKTKVFRGLGDMAARTEGGTLCHHAVAGRADERWAITSFWRAFIIGRGQQVGLCFVELLPGVYNKKYPRTVLKKTKAGKDTGIGEEGEKVHRMKYILFTGATGGLGFPCVRALAGLGYTVFAAGTQRAKSWSNWGKIENVIPLHMDRGP